MLMTIYNILPCVILGARLKYLVHREYLMHISCSEHVSILMVVSHIVH